MRIFDNGVYRDMTPEEEAMYENLPPEPISEPTAEELLNILTGVSE